MADKQSTTEQTESTSTASSVRWPMRLLWTLAVALLLVDLAGYKAGHTHFSFEAWFGFYPLFALIGCLVLMLGGQYVIGAVLRRREDYYER